MNKYYFTLLLTIILSSCNGNNEDNCGATGYPPPKFSIEFADKTTGENLFASGIWLLDEITVSNPALSQQLPVSVAVINGGPLLFVQMPAQEGSYAYIFKRNGETICVMNFDIAAEDMKCYTKFTAVNVQITNFTLEQVAPHVIKILVE